MKLSNIHLEQHNGMSKCVVGVRSDFYKLDSIFFEVPTQYETWLTTDVYDAFVIALL